MPNSLKIGSSQMSRVYALLLADAPLTARQIGVKLGLIPNAVYRLIAQLRGLGMVRQIEHYPALYVANSQSVAMGWYLLEAQRAFRREFGTDSGESLAGTAMSFVRTRGELLGKTDRDVAAARRQVCFMVSGLEVPSETILAYERAIDRGVKIRVLIQNRKDTTAETLGRWLRIGIEARLCSDSGIRMFIIDSDIVYLTTYAQSKEDEAFGLRFRYRPLAAFMSQVFDDNWASARPLSPNTLAA